MLDSVEKTYPGNLVTYAYKDRNGLNWGSHIDLRQVDKTRSKTIYFWRTFKRQANESLMYKVTECSD